MYKIAVIGEYDSIYGFAALGLDTFPVSDPDEAKQKLHKLAEGAYAVIYITEALAAVLEHEVEKYREEILPAIAAYKDIYDFSDTGSVREYRRRSGRSQKIRGAGSRLRYSLWR